MADPSSLPRKVSLPWLRPLWRQLVQTRQQGRLGHALGITWQPALGSDRLLLSLSQWLLCHESGPQPCGRCKSCHLFTSGSHPDFISVAPESDKAIGVDAVRAIQGKVQQTAALEHNKVVLVSAAQQLSTSAANALLKTLEEPPASTYVIVAPTNFARLLPTIRSRLTIMPVPVPSGHELADWLNQQVGQQEHPALWLEQNRHRPLVALAQLLSGLDQVTEPATLLRQSHAAQLPKGNSETLEWLDERLRALRQVCQQASPEARQALLRSYRQGCSLKAELQKSGLNKTVLVQHWLAPIHQQL